MTNEQWLPVPGFEGAYEVSDQGRVRSLPRPRAKGDVIKADISTTGYPYVTLTYRGHRRKRRVHQLVAEAFIGPRSPDMEVRHLDGDRLNPRLTNLAYGTSSQNKLDAVRHGTHHNAAKTHCPKGHPYDHIDPRGARRCRRCQSRASRSPVLA